MHNGNVTTAGKGQRRICLLVLGMHRSGTSALTRVTSLLGAAIGALEKIRAAFDAASPIFGAALQREIDTKRAELAVARADAAAKAARIKQLDGNIAVLRAELLTRHRSMGVLQNLATGRESQLADARRQVAIAKGRSRA